MHIHEPRRPPIDEDVASAIEAHVEVPRGKRHWFITFFLCLTSSFFVTAVIAVGLAATHSYVVAVVRPDSNLFVLVALVYASLVLVAVGAVNVWIMNLRHRLDLDDGPALVVLYVSVVLGSSLALLAFGGEFARQVADALPEFY